MSAREHTQTTASEPPSLTPTDSSPPPIVVNNVSKWFGTLVAVSDVSFEVGLGVTALLGPNGAGKSTMLRMLCGLARPSQGTVSLLGRDPRSDIDVTRQIGLVPQQETVFEPLTALEFVQLCASLHGLEDAQTAARAALATVELDPDDRRPLPTYSKGMRQRVKLAQAIAHDPKVIVLDEPLTGLDPRQRTHMIELFHRLGDEGRCVLVTSHVLDEVERFGSNVLVMTKGRLAASGDFRAIRRIMADLPAQIRIRATNRSALAGALLGDGLVVAARLDVDDVVVLDAADSGRLALELPRVAQKVGATLLELAALDDDLESVFRRLVAP